jgi:hypothetical protein
MAFEMPCAGQGQVAQFATNHDEDHLALADTVGDVRRPTLALDEWSSAGLMAQSW